MQETYQDALPTLLEGQVEADLSVGRHTDGPSANHEARVFMRVGEHKSKGGAGLFLTKSDPWYEPAASVLWASTLTFREDLLPHATDLGYAPPSVTEVCSAPNECSTLNTTWVINTFSLCKKLLTCCLS